MDIIDTTFIIREDGTSIWFPTNASRETIDAALANADKHEVRKVAVADAGCVFVHDGEDIGEQLWLREGGITIDQLEERIIGDDGQHDREQTILG